VRNVRDRTSRRGSGPSGRIPYRCRTSGWRQDHAVRLSREEQAARPGSLNGISESSQIVFRSGNYSSRLNHGQGDPVMRAALLLLASVLAFPLHAQLPVKSYGQELVDQVVARNPGLLVIVFHVSPPNVANYPIIAS